MDGEVFIAYVGDPDFHDGHVTRVLAERDSAQVFVQGHSGREHVVSFDGVHEIAMNSPVGMELYALVEMQADLPLRKFVFVNSDDDDASFLRVTARDVSVRSQ